MPFDVKNSPCFSNPTPYFFFGAGAGVMEREHVSPTDIIVCPRTPMTYSNYDEQLQNFNNSNTLLSHLSLSVVWRNFGNLAPAYRSVACWSSRPVRQYVNTDGYILTGVILTSDVQSVRHKWRTNFTSLAQCWIWYFLPFHNGTKSAITKVKLQKNVRCDSVSAKSSHCC